MQVDSVMASKRDDVSYCISNKVKINNPISFFLIKDISLLTSGIAKSDGMWYEI